MSTCLTCPPLSCSLDCQASKLLLSSLEDEAQTTRPEATSSAAAVAAVTSMKPCITTSIDQLPNEIKDQIVTYLQPDLAAIRNTRLVSRSWAFLGSPYLLAPTFTALPHRDDFTSLVEIARHPYFSQQIKTLNIRWMTLDEEELRLNLIAPHGGAVYEEDSFRKSWGQCLKMKGLINLHSDSFCDRHLLEEAFKGLTQLRELNIQSDCYLFSTTPTDTYLYDAWCTLPNNYHYKGENFHTIIRALGSFLPPTFKTLSINSFSSTFWATHLPDDEQPTMQELLRPVFESLTCLKLRVDWSQSGMERFEDLILQHENMAQSLSTALKLRELHILGYRGQRQLRQLPKSLRGIRLPNLETIVLKECDWPLPAIQDFLYSHRHTLQRVRLESYAARRSATWAQDIRSLLTMMKDEMLIEKLDFQGEVGPRRGTQLAFDLLRRAEGLYEDDWSKPNTLPKAFGTRLMAMRIEDYVVRDGPFPDFAWDI